MAASANSCWQKGLCCSQPHITATAGDSRQWNGPAVLLPRRSAKLARGGKDKEHSLLGWSPEDEALACYQCALIAPETVIRTSPLFQKGWRYGHKGMFRVWECHGASALA
jgi:hypothetical protein